MTQKSEIHYPFTQMPPPGNVLEVAPGIYWIRMPLPYALDHINLWLIEDGSKWVIVDCGIGNQPTRDLWAQLFSNRLAHAGVDRIIATHHHPDHVGNAGWLTQRFQAQLWTPQAEFLSAHALCDGSAGFDREQLASMFRANGLSEDFVPSILAGREGYKKSVPDFPLSYRRICDGDSINIGGSLWRVIMGYGHAPEHAALYCESLGVLISGDMVLPRISTNVSVPAAQPDANPLRLFLESLEIYARLPEDTLILPSHGLPFRGVRTRIAQLQEHHRLRLGELLDACQSPQSAADVLCVLFRRKLDNHQILFAMGESMAHLHYLHQLGSLRRISDTAVIRYQRD